MNDRHPTTFSRWLAICAGGELAGIAVAALCYGVLVAVIGEPHDMPVKIGAWIAATACGAPEGFVLGAAQAYGIVRLFGLGIDRSGYVVRTIVAAVIGWAVGTFFPLFMPANAVDGAANAAEPPLLATLAFAAIFGILAGLLFGLLQSRAFSDRRLRREWRIANMLGWMAGLPAIFLFAQLGAQSDGWPLRIAAWGVGGTLAGACVGLATGIALVRAASRAATPQSA